jgi:hypothetical protein
LLALGRLGSAEAGQLLRFPQPRSSLRENRRQTKALRWFAAPPRRVYGRSCVESALHLNGGEPLIEETYRMSMQSHLAELEKRHQALEDEINDCLTHPAIDDLKVVELKRRKLQVKDEIERLRLNGHASVH